MSSGVFVSSIGRTDREKPPSFSSRLERGPIVDKFFLLAACCGSVGTLYFGLQAWMMRSAVIPMTADYPLLRSSHSFIQLFLLFGFVISGFFLQAGPRLFSLPTASPRILVLPIFLLQFLGSILFFLSPSSPLPKALISASFFLTLFTIIRVFRSSSPYTAQALFFVNCLVVLTIGPWLPVSQPAVGLTIFWGTVGMAILAASQIFIGNLLGGRRLGHGENMVLHLLATIAFGFLVFASWTESIFLFQCGGGATLLSILFLFRFSRSYKLLLSPLENPIGVAMLFGAIWGSFASLLLIFSPINVDRTLHLFALGWGFPVVYVISTHILGFLCGKRAISTKITTYLILAWQVVPLTRGALPPSTSLLAASSVGLVAAAVFGSWLYTIGYSERLIFLRQAQLRGGEHMVTEA